MSSNGGDGSPLRSTARSLTALATTLSLGLVVSAGRALAHPGHEGAASEPGTWLVYGPVIAGALATVTAAGLRNDGVVSGRTALVVAAGGIALLGTGLVRWLG
ncbi:hypothetical protein HUG10_05265 [Halorarum halophilum]|uniref:Uncharacterized protein n=1 Tax=Halorarum halophilum TaxID=2743090 RepID=A0A7D5L2N3_9EURY|nr:hypothetical protein [Halobaculum halophilum]QLG26983.1 hypothetical protein HUG10_05265 [Halobaculum halophilum]